MNYLIRRSINCINARVADVCNSYPNPVLVNIWRGGLNKRHFRHVRPNDHFPSRSV